MSKESDRERKKRKYSNYGIGFGFLGGVILAAFLRFFFDTEFAWEIAPSFGGLVGLITSIILFVKRESVIYRLSKQRSRQHVKKEKKRRG